MTTIFISNSKDNVIQTFPVDNLKTFHIDNDLTRPDNTLNWNSLKSNMENGTVRNFSVQFSYKKINWFEKLNNYKFG